MAEPSETIVAQAGSDWVRTFMANGDDGTPATGLLSSDSLSCVIWAGDTQGPLFNPAIAWDSNVGPPQYVITGAAAQTSALTPGVYRGIATVSRGSQSGPIGEFWLELTESPGTGTPPPSYCSADDVRFWLPNADAYMGRWGTAGFILERGIARNWYDDAIIRNCPGNSYGGLTAHEAAIINGFGSSLLPSRLLLSYLKNNAVLVTPAVVEANAKYAAGLICSRIIPRSKDDTVRARGIELMIEAETKAINTVVQIDTNGDGFGDWAIPLGLTNTRFA
jgi:hypothetical protein